MGKFLTIKKLRNLRCRGRIIVLFLLLIVVFFQIATLAFEQTSRSAKNFLASGEGTLGEYAESILEECSSARYRPGCYDEEIPKLMGDISMEEAFEVTRIIQEKDEEYWYCHVLGHNLSARETAKDPDNWKDVIGICPSGMCSNGCIHGAFQERFRAEALPDAEVEELKPELENICSERTGWNPTKLEQATCSHALGHLGMYITDANIDKSTKICEEVAGNIDGRNLSQICFDGAFMQIFQPLEPEDFALIQGKQPQKEELASFCNQFSGQKKSSCWSEGWPLFYEEIKTPEGLVEFCSYLIDDPVQHNRCYNALFYVLTAQFNFDEQLIISLCSGLPQERRGQCFANAASRFIETDARLIDKSVRLCSFAKNFGVEKACYEELLVYSTYNFHPGSEDFFNLCAALPGPWMDKCLAGSKYSR